MRRIGPDKVRLTAVPMSDSSKLLWQQYFAPMQAAAAALNGAIAQAQNTLATALLRLDGLSERDYVLDMERMEYRQRPPEQRG